MTDDVETMLAGLEQRLRALQAELDAEEEAPAAPAPRPAQGAQQPSVAAPPPPPPPAASASTGGSPALDALDRFGDDLRRVARELVASYDRALADAHGLPAGEGILFRDEVALDATADLRGLCALGEALPRIRGVAHADLRAYAGGRGAFDLVLDRPVALVAELRGALGVPMLVVEAREGRLAIEVGSVGPRGSGAP